MPCYKETMAVRIVFFDCDGTLTEVKSSWQYLHERFNLWDENADEYQRLFREGVIGYEEFCRRDAALWKGRTIDEIESVIGEIKYHDGVRETIQELTERGIMTVILSTGLSFLIDRVKRELAITFAVANELMVCDGILTGGVNIYVGHGHKGEWVRRILSEQGFAREEAAAVGDGAGDKEMFEEVRLSIGYNFDENALPFIDHPIRDGSFANISRIILGDK
jgi:phosphoserine phosphatase